MTLFAPKIKFGLMSIILTLGLATMVHGEPDLTQQGIGFLKAQRFKEAIGVFSTMIKSDPNNVKAIYYRGMARYYLNDIDAAISDYSLALKKDTGRIEVYTSRGMAYFRKGEYKRAKKDLAAALKKSPDDLNAINQMAWMLAVCPDARFRDGKKAMALAEKAVKIKTTPNYLDTLAAVHAENGRYQKAIDIQRKVIAMLTQEERFNRLDIYLQRLKTYQAGKPWRANTQKMEIAEAEATNPDSEKIDTSQTDKKDQKDTPKSKTSEKPAITVVPVPVKTTAAVKTEPEVKPSTAEKTTLGNYPYTIFISTYQDPTISNYKILTLRQNQDPAFVSHAYFKNSGHWYQIYFGWYQDIKMATKEAENLIKRHFKKAIVVEKPYAVQAGASSSKAELKQMETRLATLNYTAYRIADSVNPNMIRVLIGAYSTKSVPDKLIDALKTARFDPKIVRR